ncbi:F0F1 ATP synthase subunit delta [Brevibacterium sp. BRM-1]|uniref:F0F1 ATP synthase subunit delta n=1 Tax=Brevibacterium sp. BRM-1 TaxID=2999062 RepID=UPI0022810809|nr:F0F1 ATP synthase subunit delta [Brevibacterium sp. BRM-1]WAL40535.1 F0F1 ATP synthase subunit delta [Brevibacterium sp. BRM-1]
MLQSSRNSLALTLEDANAGIDAGLATGLGGGLLAMVGVLADSAPLRRALADAAIAADAKRGLLSSVFGGRVDATALEVAAKAAARRWARGQDLVTALETAGVTAVAAQAQAQGRLGEVEEEIFRFTRLIVSEPELDLAFESAASGAAKAELVANLLGGRAAEETVELATQAAVHPRGKRVTEALENYSEILAFRQQRSVADVTVARPLSADQAQRLAGALSASFGRRLVLNVHVDPAVVGGVRVQIGDEVMNATIADRLADLRRRLVG